MRIVAGTHRGRAIKAPSGDLTRPTTDRVREAVFSAVASLAGEDLGGGSVLDAFAGSGALGLEALSRGCEHAVLCEENRGALSVIRHNISTLGLESRTTVVPGDVFSAAARGRLPHTPYSLLLLDPPYRLEPAKVTSLMSSLAANGQLVEGALVLWEHAADTRIEWPEGFSVARSKRYGTTEVDIAEYTRGA